MKLHPDCCGHIRFAMFLGWDERRGTRGRLIDSCVVCCWCWCSRVPLQSVNKTENVILDIVRGTVGLEVEGLGEELGVGLASGLKREQGAIRNGRHIKVSNLMFTKKQL